MTLHNPNRVQNNIKKKKTVSTEFKVCVYIDR